MKRIQNWTTIGVLMLLIDGCGRWRSYPQFQDYRSYSNK
jgi:hypothetical protein